MSDAITVDDVVTAMHDDDHKARQIFRAAFRQSLYLSTKAVICYDQPRNLMSKDTFKERSDWIQWVLCEYKRGLLEDPRSYIKSTSNSRSLPFFAAIQRPDMRYDHPSEVDRANKFLVAHPHLRGVDSRILLICDSKESAARFGGSVLTIFKSNPIVLWCFPELSWENPRRRLYGPYDPEEFSLPGREQPSESNPFFRAAGFSSSLTGGRLDIGVFNDLITDNNWKSTTEVEKRRSFLSTASRLLEDSDPKSPYGGVILVEGNRWSLDDMNSKIHDELQDWAIWRRGVYKCYVHGFGNCGRWGSASDNPCAPTQDSLWPERYPDAEALARVERDVADPEVWAAQYLNDPTTASELSERDFVPFIVEPRTLPNMDRAWAVVMAKEGKEEVLPLPALTPHIISIDPASSDEPTAARTAISWFARDPLTSRRFWIDCSADRWKPDDAVLRAVEVLAEATSRVGRTPRLLIEKVAAQSYMASAIKAQVAIHNRRSAVQIRLADVEMIPRKRGIDKDTRIRDRMGWVLRQGLLHLRTGLQLPRTEIRHFPGGTKDTLDSAAQAEEVFLGLTNTIDDEALYEARARMRELRLFNRSRTGAPI